MREARAQKQQDEQLRMFTKLLSTYPTSATQDTRALILTLIEETRDLPAFWLSCGLSRLAREPGRKFAPSLGEIRGAALEAIRTERRLQSHYKRSPGHAEHALVPERELAWASVEDGLMLEGLIDSAGRQRAAWMARGEPPNERPANAPKGSSRLAPTLGSFARPPQPFEDAQIPRGTPRPLIGLGSEPIVDPDATEEDSWPVP
ncbi:MAG: hypothetical protein ACREJT_11980 [Myxococcota bacterium]